MWQKNQRYSDSSCSEGTYYYYYSRNVPHPRMVCHMPGLNNGLICVVRNSFSQEHPSAGNGVIPQQKADREEHVLSGNARTNSCNLPRLEGFLRKERGTSQLMTRHADLPERIQSEPALSEKLLKKQFQASAQPATRQGISSVSATQTSSPFVNLRRGSHVQQNMNLDRSYLDQNIKVLGKLGQVLQTDSLTEIQKWFARASTEEKDLVSSMIFSESTDKGLLNSKEGTAEHINTQTLLKPLPSLQRGPEEKKNQSRSSSCSSLSSRNMKWERKKEVFSFQH